MTATAPLESINEVVMAQSDQDAEPLSFTYSFSFASVEKQKVPWTAVQEQGLVDYPLHVSDYGDGNKETLYDWVARTYLQFLWLPESIMPLHLLVPSLQRIPSNKEALLHPAHSLLESLLLTPATTMKKYHTDLPHLLESEEGVGEIEEEMMWFAVSHEKKVSAKIGSQAQEAETDVWKDESWRSQYLERMERREAMIQILLYMYKLSLPSQPKPPKKKPRKRIWANGRPPQGETTPEELTPAEVLESFMDRLALWQLLDETEAGPPSASGPPITLAPFPSIQPIPSKPQEPRNWQQMFCEEIVQPAFSMSLPDQVALLRSKVFPSSPFSDAEEEPEPLGRSSVPPRALSKPPLSQPLPVKPLPSRATSMSRDAARDRSRSLSVSLAQEKEARASSQTKVLSKKKILNREVSMSRVFKPRGPQAPLGGVSKDIGAKSTEMEPFARKVNLGVTLVEETPSRPRHARTASLSTTMPPLPQPDFGLAKKVVQRAKSERPPSRSQTAPSTSAPSQSSMLMRTSTVLVEADSSEVEEEDGDDDDKWTLHSSPAIHMLRLSDSPEKRPRDVDDEDEIPDSEDERIAIRESRASSSASQDLGLEDMAMDIDTDLPPRIAPKERPKRRKVVR